MKMNTRTTKPDAMSSRTVVRSHSGSASVEGRRILLF